MERRQYDNAYSYAKNNFDFGEKTRSNQKKKELKYAKSFEVKIEHCYQKIMNDLYEHIENGNCFNFKIYEKALIKNLFKEFNKTEVARITGLSIRTIRNKLNNYGRQDI